MESRILDDLEDAQEDYDHHRRALPWLVGAFVVSLVLTLGLPILMSVLHSMSVNWGEGSPFAPVVTAFIALGTGLASGDLYFDELPKRRKALKKAQRRHRDALMRAGDL